METGTLKELNVKPGDVVEMVQSYKDWYKEEHGRNYEVGEKSVFPEGKSDNCGDSFSLNNMHTFRIISRAAQSTPTPDMTAITTPFGLLDDATQDALRAHGGPYEMWCGNRWSAPFTLEEDEFADLHCYRVVKYIPQTLRIMNKGQELLIKYNLVNGCPDKKSYSIEVINDD